MALSIDDVSTAARIADDGEGITLEELALAARNHGMPLEALRYDVTPPGLHYVLVHYDIPMLSADEWRLRVHGCVRDETVLDLETLRAMPPDNVRGTVGGGGRLDRRTPRRPARCRRSERGRRGRGVHRRRPRAGPWDRGRLPARAGPGRRSGRGRPGGLRDERPAVAAPARLPGPARGAGLVRHGPRQVADRHRGRGPRVRGLPERGGLPDDPARR